MCHWSCDKEEPSTPPREWMALPLMTWRTHLRLHHAHGSNFSTVGHCLKLGSLGSGRDRRQSNILRGLHPENRVSSPGNRLLLCCRLFIILNWDFTSFFPPTMLKWNICHMPSIKKRQKKRRHLLSMPGWGGFDQGMLSIFGDGGPVRRYETILYGSAKLPMCNIFFF